ncbi:MAG: cyclic nucleotide-binding domain-containing protein [Xanthobacteraceae bacterium]|nr:MAG: cyclic nucleotide-binding domain-containing protein [Xanthobacteraceae bacterium]
MSIHDDLAALERVALLRLLGREALRMLAVGSETQRVHRGDTLFREGDAADCGYAVRDGALRLTDAQGGERRAGPGALIGETALIIEVPRDATALAEETSTVIRISRSLFQKVLESDAEAAVRLREAFAARTTQITAEIAAVRARLTQHKD